MCWPRVGEANPLFSVYSTLCRWTATSNFINAVKRQRNLGLPVKVSNRSITGYHLNTFTIRISRRFSSARKFQMGNFQKYWSQNVGQDFIVLDFFIGGRKRCVREINVSRAWDPVHAGDKALTRETPAKRGRVNRYAYHQYMYVTQTFFVTYNRCMYEAISPTCNFDILCQVEQIHV